MTSTVPEFIAWPLLAFMLVVTVLRYVFFNHSQWERYLNHTLAFMLAVNLLREHAVQVPLSEAGVLSLTATQQLSLALMIFSAAEFMGFITVYTRISLQQARIRQRYHRCAAAVAAIGFFIAASPAREAGQTLEHQGGWRTVAAWSIYVAILVVLGVQLVRMSVKELRQPKARRHEKLLAVSGIAIGLSIGISSIESPVLAAIQEAGWLYSSDYRSTLHGFIFFVESVGANVLAFIPFLLSAAALVGLDATGRHWRHLQSLREDMITAVPGVAFDLTTINTHRRKTAMDLHQTTVQIRDAILQLRGYFRDITALRAARFMREHDVPPDERDSALTALQLSDAVRAKASGATPVPVDSGVVSKSRATTLDDEASELLRLARWWSRIPRNPESAPIGRNTLIDADPAPTETSDR
jgi:hypothetical protein